MEGIKKLQSNEKGLPPCYPKSTASRSSPFSAKASASLPSALDAFQVWKKSYFMNHGGRGASSSSGTKSYFSHFGPKTIYSSLVNDLNDQNIQNPPPPSDKNTMASDADVNSAKTQPGRAANIDPNMDPKKLRRIISNRISAQKSRLKKLQYIADMEKKVKVLEDQINVLYPQVALYKKHHQMLEMEQKKLNQRMATYTSNTMLRNAEIEVNKAEVIRLRQLHQTQQQERMQGQIMMPFWESAGLEELVIPA